MSINVQVTPHVYQISIIVSGAGARIVELEGEATIAEAMAQLGEQFGINLSLDESDTVLRVRDGAAQNVEGSDYVAAGDTLSVSRKVSNGALRVTRYDGATNVIKLVISGAAAYDVTVTGTNVTVADVLAAAAGQFGLEVSGYNAAQFAATHQGVFAPASRDTVVDNGGIVSASQRVSNG